MSSFSWLDHSEEQRRRMLEVVSLFREQGTVDELGIGPVRDAIEASRIERLEPFTGSVEPRPALELVQQAGSFRQAVQPEVDALGERLRAAD